MVATRTSSNNAEEIKEPDLVILVADPLRSLLITRKGVRVVGKEVMRQRGGERVLVISQQVVRVCS